MLKTAVIFFRLVTGMLILIVIPFFASARAQVSVPWDEPEILWDTSLLPAQVPHPKNRSLGPLLEAKAALAVDIDSGLILFEKNIYERLPIASLTKIMTVLVVLDLVPQVDQALTVPSEVNTIQPSKIYLRPGDVLSVEQLILAALIHSANDAAYVLSGLENNFVERMNRKALELGLVDTQFGNAIGWDEDGNFSSAYDLAKLMRYALHQPLFLRGIGTRNLNITSQRNVVYVLENTNQLWDSFLDEVGGKTGTTDAAGPTLINIFKTPNDHRILTVLLNSPDRYQETKVLSFWVMQNFEWR